jgi:seryl-tRNA synthetase
MRTILRAGAVIASVSVLCVVVSAQEQAKRAEEVAKGMLKFQEQLASVDKQVDKVLSSLNELATPGGSVMDKYESFSKTVKDTKKLGEDARDRAKKAAEERNKFIEEWTKAQKKIQNEDLRKAAQERQAKLSPLVDGLNTSLDAVSKSAAPFMQNLNDLTLFLGNDLSASAITAAGPSIAKVTAAGAQLKKDIGASSAAVGALAAFFKPGGK